MPQFGGLMRKIPVTAITLSSRCWRSPARDSRVWLLRLLQQGHDPASRRRVCDAGGAEQGNRRLYWLFFMLPTVIAYLTAFYMMRCWMLTFWGKPRNQHLYDHAHETPMMWVPLWCWRCCQIIGGMLLGVQRAAAIFDRRKRRSIAGRSIQAFRGFSTAWHADLADSREASDTADQPVADVSQAANADDLHGHDTRREIYELGVRRSALRWRF